MNPVSLTTDSNSSSNIDSFDYFPRTAPIYEGYDINSSSAIMTNGEIFVGNQLPFEPYYFSNRYLTTASTLFPTKQCNSFNNQLTDQEYHYMNMPYNPYLFANNDQVQQYLRSPVDQAVQNLYFNQNPIIPNYRNKSTLRKPRRRSRASKDLNTGQHPKVCMNCGICETPSWRRDKTNLLLLCNACGLYEKLHDKRRPIVNENGVIKLAKGKNNGNNNRKSNTRNFKAGEFVKSYRCDEIHDSYISGHFCNSDYLNCKL